MRQLTDRQAEVLATIDRLLCDGVVPTFSRLMRLLGIGCPNSVAHHLRALARKGFIRRELDLEGAIQIVRRVDGDRLLLYGRWHSPGDTVVYQGQACVWHPFKAQEV